MRTGKGIAAHSEEIQSAVDAMETPSFCNWCEQFYDGTSTDCHHCNSDDTESYRDMPYFLEVAIEKESERTA